MLSSVFIAIDHVVEKNPLPLLLLSVIMLWVYIDLRFASPLTCVSLAIDYMVEKNALPSGHKVGGDIRAITALLFSVFPKYPFYRPSHEGE